MPGILKRLNLRLVLLPRRRLEQHVVPGTGIKGWVEVHEVHTLIGDALPQHREIIPIIKPIRHNR